MSIQITSMEKPATRKLATPNREVIYQLVRPPAHLKSFRMPEKAEIEDLKVGSSVKLIFADLTGETGGERMFVNITKLYGDGYFEAKLHSYPAFLPIRHGDRIEAHVTDIIEVWHKDSDKGIPHMATIKCINCN